MKINQKNHPRLISIQIPRMAFQVPLHVGVEVVFVVEGVGVVVLVVVVVVVVEVVVNWLYNLFSCFPKHIER